MSKIYIVLLILFCGFMLWQIPRPDLDNPPSPKEHDLLYRHPAPQATEDLLLAACYDCHSNQTQWPWYAQINPIAGFVSEHVRHGREDLNFSLWQQISAEDISVVGKVCVKRIKNHSMPIESYQWLHPAARLSASERALLIDYFLNLNPNPNEK